MPEFNYNPKEGNRPFVHSNVAGDVTKQSAMSSIAEQGPMPSKDRLRNLAKGLVSKRLSLQKRDVDANANKLKRQMPTKGR